MKANEFKAWFDGFTEAIDKVPTQKQWARIKERVAEVDGQSLTQTVYLDRYVRPYWHYYPYGVVGMATSNSISAIGTNNSVAQGMSAVNASQCASQCFDSLSAMNALSKADAKLLARA